MTTADLEGMVERVRAGDRGALARLLTIVERGGPEARTIAAAAHPHGGQAHTVGITGAPGAGKSTLTNSLVSTLRSDGSEIAVLAIDPSSPFTGGAILGDRVRMSDHVLDEGVFIRSMATRGHLGGLALAAREAMRLLDASGRPWVLVETVGVGQVEVAVVEATDTTVVVVNPGWGDAVQANKAGLMEIADVLVVNKADRTGVEDTVRDLENMLDMSTRSEWRPPVLRTVATEGDGVEGLAAAIADHRHHLESTGALVERRRAQFGEELREIVSRTLAERARLTTSGERFEAARGAVEARQVDPWTAAERLLDEA